MRFLVSNIAPSENKETFSKFCRTVVHLRILCLCPRSLWKGEKIRKLLDKFKPRAFLLESLETFQSIFSQVRLVFTIKPFRSPVDSCDALVKVSEASSFCTRNSRLSEDVEFLSNSEPGSSFHYVEENDNQENEKNRSDCYHSDERTVPYLRDKEDRC